MRACRKYRGEESCKRVLEGKPGGKRPLKCPRHRLEDNIKMDIQVVSWGGGPWTGSIWLRTGTAGWNL